MTLYPGEGAGARHESMGALRDMLQIDRFGKVAIATVMETPRLDATNATPLGHLLLQYCEQHPGSHLLLDLHHVEYLSSAVISEIIKAYRELEKSGGGLRVCGVNPYVADVFHVTNLDQLFHAIDSVREAAEQYNFDLEASE